jgi:hypothetical protein
MYIQVQQNDQRDYVDINNHYMGMDVLVMLSRNIDRDMFYWKIEDVG